MAKVFLAGATGAIGKRLVPQLFDAGCEVFGTTRSERKVAELNRSFSTRIDIGIFLGLETGKGLSFQGGRV
jgi:nucleoside-diphosphate-sugar epimerase